MHTIMEKAKVPIPSKIKDSTSKPTRIYTVGRVKEHLLISAVRHSDLQLDHCVDLAEERVELLNLEM